MEGVEVGFGCSVALWTKPITKILTTKHTCSHTAAPTTLSIFFSEIKKRACVTQHFPTLLHTLQGLSPHYIVEFFIENKGRAWESLGGVMLTLTGAEALFADLGHFNISSVGVGFSFFVYPCIIIAYLGQVSWCVECMICSDNMGAGCCIGWESGTQPLFTWGASTPHLSVLASPSSSTPASSLPTSAKCGLGWLV